MLELWAPNPEYDESQPQSWHNMPTRRIYANLTPEELERLLRDAKEERWEVLDLRYTNIKALPDFIGKLKSLQALDLRDTDIDCLPDSIGNMINLRELNLSRTPIRALPDSIGNLKNLHELDLHRTQISALPDSIGKLTSLQALDLHSAPISDLPDSIGNLKSLQALNLYHTNISALPDSIGNLTNLQSLTLYRTNIRTLPDSIGNLRSLQTLDLSYCHLKAIPYSVVGLGLPFVIDNYMYDNCVNLTDVTLDEGDISLFAQPREVIEAYYREKAEEGVKECKVIFLGDGAAGKSSLIERMVNGRFVPGSLPTDGVKMTKWKPPMDGNAYTLRFLDFGGQEIMHSMHRCFLTAHTVYVVVCESRDDPEIDAIAARWLETVKAFAPDCPVILALNKCDLNPHVSVNERDLKARNPRLILKSKENLELQSV